MCQLPLMRAFYSMFPGHNQCQNDGCRSMSLNACEQGDDAFLQCPEDISHHSSSGNFLHIGNTEAQAIPAAHVERSRDNPQNDRLHDLQLSTRLVVENSEWRSIQQSDAGQAVEWPRMVRDVSLIWTSTGYHCQWIVLSE